MTKILVRPSWSGRTASASPATVVLNICHYTLVCDALVIRKYHFLFVGCVVKLTKARLRNHNATDDGNVDFRSLKKFYIQSLENKVVDLLVQKLLNDMTLE